MEYENEMTRYKIQYLTLQGHVLTFTVSKYDINENGIVIFTDEKNGEIKNFHISRCEISEVKQ
jgi:hypothetical protein